MIKAFAVTQDTPRTRTLEAAHCVPAWTNVNDGHLVGEPAPTVAAAPAP